MVLEKMGALNLGIILSILAIIIASIKLYFGYLDRKDRKLKDLLNSNKKTWIAIMQSNHPLKKGGVTHNGFSYHLDKETWITEKEKQYLEENLKEYFQFKKLKNK